jgi:hypothetical protein
MQAASSSSGDNQDTNKSVGALMPIAGGEQELC